MSFQFLVFFNFVLNLLEHFVFISFAFKGFLFLN